MRTYIMKKCVRITMYCTCMYQKCITRKFGKYSSTTTREATPVIHYQVGAKEKSLNNFFFPKMCLLTVKLSYYIQGDG